MDRHLLLEELKELRCADNKILLSTPTLNSLNSLSDDNLKCFYEFANQYLIKRKSGSAGQYISTTQRYLKYISDISCSLENSTTETIESFLNTYGNNSSNDIENKIRYLTPLFKCFELDANINFKSLKPKNTSPVKHISRIQASNISKAIEKYSQLIKTNNNEITDRERDKYIKKLFILEMFFFTHLTIEDIKKYQKGECDFDSNNIYFQGIRYPVPQSLISLMKEMDTKSLLHGTHYTRGTTEEIQKDLCDYGMQDISSQGAKNTRDAIFWTCPQCGEKYLAIAENWCVKQYTDNGENWVVCRENCSDE